jgi:hypothetical protein
MFLIAVCAFEIVISAKNYGETIESQAQRAIV